MDIVTQIEKLGELQGILSKISEANNQIWSNTESHKSYMLNFTEKQKLRQEIERQESIVKGLHEEYLTKLCQLNSEVYNELKAA